MFSRLTAQKTCTAGLRRLVQLSRLSSAILKKCPSLDQFHCRGLEAPISPVCPTPPHAEDGHPGKRRKLPAKLPLLLLPGSLGHLFHRRMKSCFWMKRLLEAPHSCPDLGKVIPLCCPVLGYGIDQSPSTPKRNHLCTT